MPQKIDLNMEPSAKLLALTLSLVIVAEDLMRAFARLL